MVECIKPMGSSDIALAVTDAAGRSATDTVNVTIQDMEAPSVAMGTSASKLWPPNHKMVDVIVLSEQHLRRVLRSYFQYYHRSRCHLSLDGEAPESRPVQGPERGQAIVPPEVGGFHHRYVRKAA